MKKSDWEKNWRDYLIKSLFSGEQVGIRRLFHLAPKRQCWIEWQHLEKTVAYLLQQARQEGIEEILPTLYQIRASIPLTQGMGARKQIKGLIDKLELKKKEGI